MRGGVYIMKGTIIMEFHGDEAKITAKLTEVGIKDKCVAVDSLLEALEAEGIERLLILAAVVEAAKKDKEVDRR
jgi:hypothetical protein